MPVADVFLPLDTDTADLARRQQGPRRLDCSGLARMPRGKKRAALLAGQRFQRVDFGQGRSWRLLQHDMLAGLKGCLCLGKATLGRRTERHRVDGDIRAQKLLDVIEGSDAVQSRIAAGNGDEIDAVRRGDRSHMLVPGNLSQSDDVETNGHTMPPCWSPEHGTRAATPT